MTRPNTSTPLSISGAIAFSLWGLLHVVGSGFILTQLATGGAAAAYDVYGVTEPPDQAIAGAALGYMSYFVAIFGLVVCGVALRLNWRNSERGLALNTALVLIVELGLVIFLILPGHVSLAEALPGFILFLAGATLGGVACQRGAVHGT